MAKCSLKGPPALQAAPKRSRLPQNDPPTAAESASGRFSGRFPMALVRYTGRSQTLQAAPKRSWPLFAAHARSFGSLFVSSPPHIWAPFTWVLQEGFNMWRNRTGREAHCPLRYTSNPLCFQIHLTEYKMFIIYVFWTDIMGRHNSAFSLAAPFRVT